MEGGGVGQAAMGETHEIAYVDLPPICAQPKGKLLSVTMFKRSLLTQIKSERFFTCIIGRVFEMHVERTYSWFHTLTNEFSVNYCNFHNIPAKAEPKCQATFVEFGSPHEAICVCRYIYLPIIHSYWFPSYLPTCATRAAGVVHTSTYPIIQNTTVNVMRPKRPSWT
jgi:hypothetical protein